MYRTLSVVILGAVLAACGGEKGGEAKPAASPEKPAAINLPADSIVVTSVSEVHPSFELPAVVEAVQMARVRPEVSAVIEAIHFSPGQVVEKGDLLIEFDDSTYKALYESAEASIKSAEAARRQAQANWKRAEDLAPKGFISQQDFDKAQAAIDSARAAMAAAEAAHTKAELDLSHTRIYAPFSGKISKPFYAVGDSVVPSSPNSNQPLFTLVQIDPIYVTAGVELKEYHKFVLLRRELQEKGDEIPELEVGLVLAGGEAYPHSGEFEAWDNVSMASSGTISGRVLFPNPDTLLLPGHNVTIRGEMLRAFNRVLIPQKAVLQDQQGYYVKVVDDDDTVARRNVELGIRYKDAWVVLDGLEEGARVITVGAQMLREGMAVALQ